MNDTQWAGVIGAIGLAIAICHDASADILRARSPVENGNGPTVDVVFSVGGQPVPATSRALQPDGSMIFSATVGEPFPALPYDLGATLCRGDECVEAAPIVVSQAPPSRLPAPLQQPYIKSCTDASPGFIRCQWKARDGAPELVVDEWESRRQDATEWVPIAAERIPTTGIPSNEAVSQIEAPPGCHEYRVRVTGDGYAPSPVSVAVPHGTCVTEPPEPPLPSCQGADLNQNGAVDLADVAIVFGLAATVDECRD